VQCPSRGFLLLLVSTKWLLAIARLFAVIPLMCTHVQFKLIAV
jgi:hypothetical protein